MLQYQAAQHFREPVTHVQKADVAHHVVDPAQPLGKDGKQFDGHVWLLFQEREKVTAEDDQ